MDKDNNQLSRNCAVLTMGLILPLGILFLAKHHFGEGNTQLINVYLTLIAIFVLMFAAYRLLSYYLNKDSKVAKVLFSARLGIVYSILIISVCIFCMLSWNLSWGNDQRFVRSGGVAVGYYIALLVLVCIGLGALKGTTKIAFPVVCIITVGIIFAWSLVTNMLNEDFYVVFHYPIASDSVFNVAKNIPYSAYTSSNYGHYALFFWPFLKLLGDSPQYVYCLFSCFNVISQIAFFYLVFKITKNNVLRAIAVFASIGGAGISPLFVVIIWPLRTMGPLLILAYIVWQYSNNKFSAKNCLLGFLLCGLGVTWNTDSGIAATLTYMVSLWVVGWKTEPILSAKMVRLYLLTIVGGICAVAEMIVIVNLYNILCGGQLILKECFFPLGTELSNIEWVDVHSFGHSWLFPISTFIISIVLGLLPVSFIKVREDQGRLPITFFGIMGLSMSYYYINRSIAGWLPVGFLLVLCLTCVVDQAKVWKEYKRKVICENVNYATGICGFMFLCMFCLNGVLWLPTFFSQKIDTGITSMDSLKSVAKQIEQNVPKDTFAYGYYVQDVYGYLDWDIGHTYHNSLEIWHAEELKSEINSQERILIAARDYDLIDENSGLIQVEAFPKDNPLLLYYVNIDAMSILEVPVDQNDLTMKTDGWGHIIAGVPFSIKSNTLYRIDFSLPQDTDFSLLSDIAVDFYGENYDRGEQQKNAFVQSGVFDYSFVFNSGEIESETIDGYVRVIASDFGKEIPISSLRVSELKY